MQGGPDENMATVYYFNIPSIMCTSCTADIEAQVKKLSGIHEVVANDQLRTAMVTVTDPSVTASDIANQIYSKTKKHHVATLSTQETKKLTSAWTCNLL